MSASELSKRTWRASSTASMLSVMGVVMGNASRCAWVVLSLSGLALAGQPASRDAAPSDRSVTVVADKTSGQNPAQRPTSSAKAEADAIRAEQYGVAERLNRDFPRDFEALRILGFVHSSHGNTVEMIACWKECRNLAPDRADIVDQLARQAAAEERHEEAVALWREALQLDDQLHSVRQPMSISLLSLGKTDEAIELLNAQWNSYPQADDERTKRLRVHYAAELAELQYWLGEAYFQKQAFQEAQERYAAAVELVPNHAKAYYGLVKTSTRLKQKDNIARYTAEFKKLDQAAIAADAEVRKQYDDLVLMRQRAALTCFEAGVRYAKAKRREDAEPLWRRAAELDENHVGCRVYLLGLSRAEGKKEEAIQILQQLTRIQPRHLDYWEQLGFLQAGRGDLSAAERALRKMIEVAPRKSDGYRALAKLYLNSNQNLEAASKLAETAVELEPIADSYFVAGWARAKSGKTTEARSALEKAVRLDPKNQVYRQLLEAVNPRP